MRTRELTKRLKKLGYDLHTGTNRLGVEGFMITAGGGVLGHCQAFSATRQDVEEFLEWKENPGILKTGDL